jgi:hypothetical protein
VGLGETAFAASPTSPLTAFLQHTHS